MGRRVLRLRVSSESAYARRRTRQRIAGCGEYVQLCYAPDRPTRPPQNLRAVESIEGTVVPVLETPSRLQMLNRPGGRCRTRIGLLAGSAGPDQAQLDPH